MSDRGMKKWAPYKSLIEHEPALKEMQKNREKISKPKISNEEAEAINEVLINYHGQEVEITYFRNGEIKEIITAIKKIDSLERKLILIDRKIIQFSELISIKSA